MNQVCLTYINFKTLVENPLVTRLYIGVQVGEVNFKRDFTGGEIFAICCV